MVRYVQVLLLCVLCGLSTSSRAVQVNPRGLGQVLLFPYYTVRSTAGANAYNTLFLINNTSSDTKAVRVRFRESRNGREVAAINLFLTPYDSWAAAIVPANPGAQLVTFDASCVDSNPAATATQNAIRVPFGVANFTGANADGGDGTADRTAEGFFEVIEMGVVEDQTTLDALNPDRGNNALLPNCSTISAVHLDNGTQVSAPTGGLMGDAFVINVLDGTLYPYEATALDNFSSQPIWAPVTTSTPTLQDVNPKVSNVLDGQSIRTSMWDPLKGSNRADAVSAVLMQDQLLNHFVLDSATASQTDWVVTMPTKPFYTDPALTGSNTAIPPFETAFTGPGAPDYFGIQPTTLAYGYPPDQTQTYDREGHYLFGVFDFGPNPPAPTLYLKSTASVLSFYPSNLFGASGRAMISSSAAFVDGWARLVPYQYSNSAVHQLVSTEVPPQTYFGLPMIGFMANNYVNGTLSGPTGPVLSNYGATSPHKGTVRVQ